MFTVVFFVLMGLVTFALGLLVGQHYGTTKVIYITPEEADYMTKNFIDNVADQLEINPYNLPKNTKPKEKE